MNNIERRTIKTELRLKEEASRTVVGYAVVFNQLSDPIYWFREKISPNAFDDADMTDVVALFNHDPNIVFARVPKTLRLSVDDYGLRYEFEAPNTSAGNDLIELLNRGDVYQSSFAFTVKKESWEEYNDPNDRNIEAIRTIESIEKLYDVSPVVFPAYPSSTVYLDDLRKNFENRCRKEQDEAERLAESERSNRLRLLDYKIKIFNFLNY